MIRLFITILYAKCKFLYLILIKLYDVFILYIFTILLLFLNPSSIDCFLWQLVKCELLVIRAISIQFTLHNYSPNSIYYLIIYPTYPFLFLRYKLFILEALILYLFSICKTRKTELIFQLKNIIPKFFCLSSFQHRFRRSTELFLL